jgi:hypothetical protein
MATRKQRIDLVLSIVFLVLGIVVVANFFLTQRHIAQAHDELFRITECNQKLIDSLQTRSVARSHVDSVVRSRDAAMIAWLNELLDGGQVRPGDQHLVELRDRAIAAYDVRRNDALYVDYPTC